MPKRQKSFRNGVEVVGSAIIENDKDEILLAKSTHWHNKWVLPGGHIEPGEKIEEALLREAEEETGLKLKSLGIIGYGELIDSTDYWRPAHFIYFDIVCFINSPQVKLDNNELSEYVWIRPKQALKMDLAESYAKSIENYISFKSKLS